jgi:hypothetical protein
MAQYVEVEEAIGMSGLRVVLTPSVPGPWTEAAKAILRVKNLPYVKVRQELLGENLPLLKWTKQATAPVFVYTVIGITVTMSIGLTMGWLLRTERDTSLLVTVGTAICGGSAIAAVAPAIRAKHHEVSVALATVFF